MKKQIIGIISLAFLATIGTSFAYSYAGYGRICTKDAYVCPNGITVGRTGPDCSFVCSGSSVTYTQPSYYYTSGCYTYYYNGNTRTTSVVGYSCASTQTTYTTPYTSYYTQPTYYTYQYTQGSWYPSYQTYQNNTTYGYDNTGYSNYPYWNSGTTYGNYYGNPNYANNYKTGCYYQNGQMLCY